MLQLTSANSDRSVLRPIALWLYRPKELGPGDLSAAACRQASTAPSISVLPDDLLLLTFSKLQYRLSDRADPALYALPAVCRSFRDLCRKPSELWTDLDLGDRVESFHLSFCTWLQPRYSAIKHVWSDCLDIQTVAWLAGLLAPSLETLSIDRPGLGFDPEHDQVACQRLIYRLRLCQKLKTLVLNTSDLSDELILVPLPALDDLSLQCTFSTELLTECCPQLRSLAYFPWDGALLGLSSLALLDLRLTYCYGQAELEGLSCLSALTGLQLYYSGEAVNLTAPPKLAHLGLMGEINHVHISKGTAESLLRLQLDYESSSLMPAYAPEMHHLANLQNLTAFEIVVNRDLHRDVLVSQTLARLPQLQTLSVTGAQNILWTAESFPTPQNSLTGLQIDMEGTLSLHAMCISVLPALQMLKANCSGVTVMGSRSDLMLQMQRISDVRVVSPEEKFW